MSMNLRALMFFVFSFLVMSSAALAQEQTKNDSKKKSGALEWVRSADWMSTDYFLPGPQVQPRTHARTPTNVRQVRQSERKVKVIAPDLLSIPSGESWTPVSPSAQSAGGMDLDKESTPRPGSYDVQWGL